MRSSCNHRSNGLKVAMASSTLVGFLPKALYRASLMSKSLLSLGAVPPNLGYNKPELR